MEKTTMSFKIAAKVTAVAAICTLGISILTSGSVYAQTANQTQSGDASWLWWLLPLAALGILFFILRRSLQIQRDDYQERFGFGDEMPMAGVKGGRVNRDHQADEDMDLEEDLEDERDRKDKAEPWDRSKDDWNL